MEAIFGQSWFKMLVSAGGCILLCGGCAVSGPALMTSASRRAVDELLATDESFSRGSQDEGTLLTLSAMFAAEVVMPIAKGRFAEGAAQVIETLLGQPDNAHSKMAWVPIRGGIAADGQHGFTLGYMILHKPDNSTVPFKYLAYWVKQPTGWRVVAYKRSPRKLSSVSAASIERMPPLLPLKMVTMLLTSPDQLGMLSAMNNAASLEQAERSFSRDAQIIGLGPAFMQYGGADAIHLGDANEAGFIIGPEAISRAVAADGPAVGSSVYWAPDKVIVASSGDLGVSIGVIHLNKASANEAQSVPSSPGFSFFTVWHRASANDPWRYVAE